MGRKISYEDAFPTVQRRCRELFDANLLLEAQVDTLERQLAEAQEENTRLQQGSSTPTPLPPAGPDLAAQPPFPDDERV